MSLIKDFCVSCWFLYAQLVSLLSIGYHNLSSHRIRPLHNKGYSKPCCAYCWRSKFYCCLSRGPSFEEAFLWFYVVKPKRSLQTKSFTKIHACLPMQGCALVFARISPLVLLRKTLGRALDCF